MMVQMMHTMEMVSGYNDFGVMLHFVALPGATVRGASDHTPNAYQPVASD